MPIFSTMSSVSRIPAVSTKRNCMPLMIVVSSMKSRVVPCTLLTMAFSSCRRLLSRVLLPTLVFPTIATGMPFFRALPTSKERASETRRRWISLARAYSSERSANSSSSWSEKSISNSRSDVSLRRCARSSDSSLLKCPFSWLSAISWVALFVELIRSATASACDRSILPLRNARCVNSPGPAGWQPFCVSNIITWLST